MQKSKFYLTIIFTLLTVLLFALSAVGCLRGGVDRRGGKQPPDDSPPQIITPTDDEIPLEPL